MTELDAAADNADRDGAPGGAGALARSPRPGTPPPLTLTWVPEARRDAGGSQRQPGGGSQPPAAPPGAPSVFYGRGDGKQGHGRIRASENKTPERRSVG